MRGIEPLPEAPFLKICALFLSLLLPLVGCPAWAEDEIVTGPDRRHEIDLRIEALDARRAEISTRRPKVATWIGVGVALVGGGIVGASASQCPNRDQGDCASFGLVMAGAAVTSIGILTSIGAGVVWGVRVHRLNGIDAERESLIEERDGLPAALSRLELRSPYRDGTQFVTLGLRF